MVSREGTYFGAAGRGAEGWVCAEGATAEKSLGTHGKKKKDKNQFLIVFIRNTQSLTPWVKQR